MRKNNRGDKHNGNNQAKAAKRRMFAHMVILVLLTAGVLTAMALFISHARHNGVQSTASQTAAGFDPLRGRWQRPDGGYILEIRGIEANGKMAAAYFNPRPINVSQAEAALDGTTVKVFIELRDINYPGATYHLTYYPESDQLRGVYFQPALQQSFEVFFVRIK
ncbi:MAG: hypothetical protein ACOZF2_06860 [Thermodesulfobacteriota bacterium]